MTKRILILAGALLTAATADAGQIQVINQGTVPVGFYLYDGTKYLDSGRANPPAGTVTTRQVPDREITVVLFRGNAAAGGKAKDKNNDQCQVTFAKGVGTVEVISTIEKLNCKQPGRKPAAK